MDDASNADIYTHPSPTPSSDSASESDAFNTADARIYFGPLRSPEKKFAPLIVRHETLHPGSANPSPRRSPRLSTPRPRSPIPSISGSTNQNSTQPVSEEVDGKFSEDISLLRLRTPETEHIFQDEPSTVLANRVIQAHDNPSPPPSPLNTTIQADVDVPLLSLLMSPSPSFDPSAGPTDGDQISQNYLSGTGCLSPAEPLTALSKSSPTPLNHIFISPNSFANVSINSPFITTQRASDSHLISNDSPSVDDPSCFPNLQIPVHPELSSSSLPITAVGSGSDDAKEVKAQLEMISETIDTQTVANMLSLTDVDSVADMPVSYPNYVPNGQNSYLNLPLIEHIPSPVPGSLPDAQEKGDMRPQDISHHKDKDTEGPRSNARELGGGGVKDAFIDIDGQEQDEKKRKKDRTIQRARGIQTTHREIRSLSPTSTSILTQLLPSPTKDPMQENLTLNETDGTSLTEPSIPIISPFHTPLCPTTPTPGPMRLNSSQSPTKTRLPPTALDTPNKTPARRIPIEEAITQGYISPQKFIRSTVNGRMQVLNIPPTDSPARRVPVPDITTPSGQNKWQQGIRPIRFGSPTRGISEQKTRSIGPQPLASSSTVDKYSSTQQQRTTKSGPPPRPQTHNTSMSSTMPRPVKLPFPIVSSRAVPPSLVSEVSKTSSESKVPSPHKTLALNPGPTKSVLKQTSSKIPRGVKPYARPIPKAHEKSKPISITKTSNLPKSINTNTDASQPTMKLHTEPASGSDSDAGVFNSGLALESPAKSTATPSLKRKRVSEKSPPLDKPRPVVLLRQVPKAPVQKPLQSIRLVVDQPPEAQSDQQNPQDSCTDNRNSGQESETTLSFKSTTSEVAPPSSSEPQHNTLTATESGRRRTTRTRKPIKPTIESDIFGGPDVRSVQPSRKGKGTVQPPARLDDTFSGMSVVALKALTSSNTIKNQKYLAAKLETEVVRKKGVRPESPTVKIRTISQRQQDEKSRQRKERAARRAKRGDDGSGVDQNEMDDQSDVDSSSNWDNSPILGRHRRGAGDEDYETPIRSESPTTRSRFGEQEKRVKWDRGLFTTIYVDEVKVGTRPPPHETITKGCLAPAAKTVNLDNLGNLLNVHSPLNDLVEESIIVKKFVYDNDVEPLPQIVAVKNTRLRSKKGKV